MIFRPRRSPQVHLAERDERQRQRGRREGARRGVRVARAKASASGPASRNSATATTHARDRGDGRRPPQDAPRTPRLAAADLDGHPAHRRHVHPEARRRPADERELRRERHQAKRSGPARAEPAKIRTLTANEARTKTASPAMFWPVPDRSVRRSSLEVAKAAEVLLHLLRLGLVEALGGRRRSLRRARRSPAAAAATPPTAAVSTRPECRTDDGAPDRGEDGGRQVHQVRRCRGTPPGRPPDPRRRARPPSDGRPRASPRLRPRSGRGSGYTAAPAPAGGRARPRRTGP